MKNDMSSTSICAVIVTFNPDQAGLRRLMSALIPQVQQVVVVDNGSDDDMASHLAEFPVTLLPLGENTGVAAGFNRGIAWAREHGYEKVLLFDQDSVPADDMVELLDRTMAELSAHGEKVAAVGPLARDPRTGHEVGFGRMGLFRFRYVGKMADHGVFPVDFLISSGSLIPIAVLYEIGVMDEGLFIDLVDTEWCLRSAARGFRVYGVSSAILNHGVGEKTADVRLGERQIGSFSCHGPSRHYYIFRNSLLISSRSYVPWRWVFNNAVQLLGMLVYFPLTVRPRLQHLKMMLKGLLDGALGRSGRLLP